MALDEDVVERAQTLLGTVLRGKYRLDRVLGVGGMATVFAATHRNGKEFAVKLLHPGLSHQGDMRARFLREGYVANAVKHPGAVMVLDDDVGEDGSAFIVMELLEGKTVEDLWDQYDRRLALPVVTAIGLQVLDVLASAHAHQIIHRDIKPANLFITRSGQLKVLDFGIARIRDLASSFAATQSGLTLGTPAFMAPEQAIGKASEIGPQTDLWAAGATMFTLASGHLVHQAESQHELLIKAATTSGRSLVSVLPGVPQLFSEIVDRATPFAVRDRWASATAMREALRHASIAVFGKTPSEADLIAALGGHAIEPAPPTKQPAAGSSAPPAAPMVVVGGLPPIQPAMSPPPPPPGRPITAEPVYRSQGPPSRPSRVGIAVVALGAITLLAGALGVMLVLRKPSARSAAEPAPLQTSVAEPAMAPSPTGGAPALAPAPVPPASASVSAPAPAPGLAASASASVLAPAAASAPVPSRGCDPPFVVDAQGVKKWKRMCL